MHQLISVTHEIYASFDSNPSLEVFLRYIIYFDRVIYEGLIYKRKYISVKCDLLFLTESFLFEKQPPSRHTTSYRRLTDVETTSCVNWARVVLNGQESK